MAARHLIYSVGLILLGDNLSSSHLAQTVQYAYDGY